MNAHAHREFGILGREEAPPPKGRHVMEIIESDVFSLGDASEFAFRAQIVGGKHDGHHLDFHIVVTRHFGVDEEGYEAETERGERGDREYAALRWATGVFDPRDTEEFYFKPFAATISYRNGSYRVDGFDRPRAYDAANDDAPAPKRTKPTPPRGPDGRFLKTDYAEAAPEPAQTAKPWEEVHQGSALPTEPETVPYAQYSRCWQQLDKLSQIAFKMKMAWGLLGPKIADELGRSTGPLNGLLKDGGDGLYVMATEDVEIIEYHLIELGNLIEQMHAADAA